MSWARVGWGWQGVSMCLAEQTLECSWTGCEFWGSQQKQRVSPQLWPLVRLEDQSWKKAELNYCLAKQNKDTVNVWSICYYVKKKNPVGSVVTWGWFGQTAPPPTTRTKPANNNKNPTAGMHSGFLIWIVTHDYTFFFFNSQHSHTHKHTFEIKTPNPLNKTYFMSHTLYPVQA